MVRKCREYLNDLNDFLDGELPEELCEEIENHVGQCNNCRIMIDTLKKTVTLCREGSSEKLPDVLAGKLNNLLAKRWQEKFGS